MSRVSITAVGERLDAAFALAMERAGCVGVIPCGGRVVVKPNWNGCGATGSTSVAVVEAACRWALAQGAGDVLVGEGPVPIGRERIEQCFTGMGVYARLGQLGVRFVNFDDGEYIMFRGQPDLPPEIGVARLALECDTLINVPLMKVHSCCLATLCVKNLKGCLRPQDKMAFHRVGLLPAIVALNRIVRPQINVIDAIDAMEGLHNNGDLVHLGLLIAGCDPVATDAVGCAQMGMDPEKVPLLRMVAAAGLGVHRLAEIEQVGEPLQPRRFELVQDRLHRLYPDLEIIDEAACTACRAALMDGLYIAGGTRRAKVIAMGAKSKPPEGALTIGKCLRGYRASHLHVDGCPPTGRDVAEGLAQAPKRSA